MRGSRVHRLPQRLDWTLIPPPLDLSLPEMAEKSPLPAIIVTPSSPSSNRDFAIAFLAPTEKPSMRTRLTAYTKQLPASSFPFKARSIFLLLLLIFIIMCHLVTHRLAERRHHLDFSVQGGNQPVIESLENLLDLTGFWGSKVDDTKRDFVITDN